MSSIFEGLCLSRSAYSRHFLPSRAALRSAKGARSIDLRLSCKLLVLNITLLAHTVAANQVCTIISVTHSEGVNGSTSCESARGTFVRSATDFNERPFFIHSDSSLSFYIYHFNTTNLGWRLSSSAGSIETEACDCAGYTTRDDATMGPKSWQCTSGEILTISCGAHDHACYTNSSRPSGCRCDFSENGGTVITDSGLCSSGCCRNDHCEPTQAWCLRFWIIGSVAVVLALLLALLLLWRPRHGLLHHTIRRVTPEPVKSHEEDRRLTWDTEVEAAASRGLVMTWWAYGENVEVPAMEIYDVKQVRVGVEIPSVLDPVKITELIKSKVEMGGFSFVYTAEAIGDNAGVSIGHPLVMKYQPYKNDIELPRLTKQKRASSAKTIDAVDKHAIQERSRSSVPAVAEIIRSTSSGGFVNGWPVIRPETGAQFADPYRKGTSSLVQRHQTGILGDASIPQHNQQEHMSDKKVADKLAYNGRLSNRGESVTNAIARLRESRIGLSSEPSRENPTNRVDVSPPLTPYSTQTDTNDHAHTTA